MKKLFTIASILLLTGFTSVFGQKLAHVNSQEVLMALPEVKTAEQFLISKQKEAETEMQGLQAEYQSKINEFQQMQQNPNALQTLVENKYNEIMSLEKTMQEFGNNKQVELEELQQQQMTPILEKVKLAIADYGRVNGYTYIFDNSVGVILYDGGEDLTAKIVAELLK